MPFLPFLRQFAPLRCGFSPPAQVPASFGELPFSIADITAPTCHVSTSCELAGKVQPDISMSPFRERLASHGQRVLIPPGSPDAILSRRQAPDPL
jgi:hypothetical protein